MPKATTTDQATVTAYKAFDKDWKCQGFQFEVGQTYTHPRTIALCEQGFHACLMPFDVLAYYSVTNNIHFAQVELSGVSAMTQGDSKRVAKTITIVKELTIDELIAAQIAWVKANAPKNNTSSGNSSTAASSGNSSTAASSGYASTAASSGDASTAASSGYSSKAASSGYSSKAASSGDASTAASSGDASKAASSGNASTAASSGDASKAASSGNASTAASSGNYSTAASSGDASKAACDTNGFACVAGIAGKVKGNAGSALSLGYQDAEGHNRIVVAYVGEHGILADTWYHVNQHGEFSPC